MTTGFVAGALGGLLAVVILVFLLPKRWGHLRPLVAALGGGVLFYLLQTYVK